MGKTNLVTIILVLALIGLAGFTYYLYSEAKKCEAIAIDLGTRLQACGAGLEQCMAGATVCQEALTGLKQIPACAPYLPGE